MDKLERAAEAVRLEATESADVRCVSSDVSVEDSVVALFDQIGVCVDLLVNNAGTNVPGATVDLSARDFEYVMKVNVLGPFLCAREAMKRMMERGAGGRIINIGSISAIDPRPHSCPYTASKFALTGLTRSLALDARPHGIAVGLIHPGNVLSELLTPEMIASRQHEGFLDAEQVAASVLHMASLPYTANVLEMTMIPTTQPLVGRG
jgi:NAD(P)-dependent dehydrogenase (short-subunit alcohol dehydrogenase family)